MKYLIVEDERFAYEEMKRMMEVIRPAYQLTGWTETVEQTVLYLKQHTVDLILMDIRLADGSCFEIFEQIQLTTPVIFTTAYDEYAIRAFKVNSIDYLLKPIEEADLQSALQKFEQNRATSPSALAYRKLEEAVMGHHKRNRFLIQKGDAYYYVETSDIAFFYSEEKVVFLHTFSDKRYIVDYTLEQLEQALDEKVFFRVSRNCIANIKSIRKIAKYFNSRLKLYFQPECPHEVLVSRLRVSDFLKWIDGGLE
ncbi:two-component system response regulator LytT [Parabacteroides sp. PF5-5]|uniref:LytR/AlgR family response regulator transcription factor n=1 Tax=unclassified Parabacteroides TaxID=2649774 RepID=UPI002475F8FC|nr:MULTISPECIES: LytTR family DNA-binding domain-containing protein [unclassified Parabacteroides]MDH6303620.1 two-component system response regulator LytT [Parabacteroides sp. PH5-39]MDH6314942.1 two-component system response regulator LytT [Parabacteroides sp. PF5-13]MDH6318279.1 two-component system response regulator LytT [Parabacteroides sp. PH5-13]MDH6321788.1 two-component system response regulator LytT [Parabacteroides sp. PH5-8]MDH6325912.1 two-component system response regulator LytT